MARIRTLFFGLAFSAGLAATPSSAAEIVAAHSEGTTVIAVSGDIEFGDQRKFIDVALAYPSALVAFNSFGGNLSAGIEIGKAIRLKGYSTYVGNGSVCASACALAWLGGQSRLLSTSGLVGFHAAFIPGPGGNAITSSGNAIVGAYLNQLGLSSSAIIYVTAAAPADMRWLTADDARNHGLDVRSIAETRPPVATPPAVLDSYVVQIAVRATEQDARAAWDQAQIQFGVLLGGKPARLTSATVNGRTVHRVRLGPMSKTEADTMCSRLKTQGSSCFVVAN